MTRHTMKLPFDTNIFPRQKKIYIVGGSIRDLLVGRPPVDYDLVVAHDPNGFARSLAARVAGRVVEFGKHGHTILRVVSGDSCFDISPLNGATIEVDLGRRDFTINAMALELSSGALIDPTGGRRDLASKMVRSVTDDVFRQDPVRLIRAYRMAASFNLSIEKITRTAISRDADQIHKSAGERIREELFKILLCSNSHAQLVDMAHCKLLFSVFPEMLQLKNCPLSGDMPTGWFEQTLDAYDHLERLLYNRSLNLPAPGNQLYKDIKDQRAVLLKWAVLLHDIGKPAVGKVSGDGRVHFCGHASQSAILSRAICRRLRFSRRQTDMLEFIIRHQRRPFSLFTARPKNISTPRAFIRLFMKCGDRTPDIFLHALAVLSSRTAVADPTIQKYSEFMADCMNDYYSLLSPRASQPLPINGNDLIKKFGLKPSAAFKRILKAVEEEHLARDNLTRRQALDLVHQLL